MTNRCVAQRRRAGAAEAGLTTNASTTLPVVICFMGLPRARHRLHKVSCILPSILPFRIDAKASFLWNPWPATVTIALYTVVLVFYFE